VFYIGPFRMGDLSHDALFDSALTRQILFAFGEAARLVARLTTTSAGATRPAAVIRGRGVIHLRSGGFARGSAEFTSTTTSVAATSLFTEFACFCGLFANDSLAWLDALFQSGAGERQLFDLSTGGLFGRLRLFFNCLGLNVGRRLLYRFFDGLDRFGNFDNRLFFGNILLDDRGLFLKHL